MYTPTAAKGIIRSEPIPNPQGQGRGTNPGTSLVLVNPISEEEYRMLVGNRKKNISPSKYASVPAAKKDAVREAIRKFPEMKPHAGHVASKALSIYSDFYAGRGKAGLERGSKWRGVSAAEFSNIYKQSFQKRHKKIVEKAKNKTELEKMLKEAFAEKGDPKGKAKPAAKKPAAKKPAAKKPAAKKPAAKKPAAKKPAAKKPAAKKPAAKKEKPQAVEIKVTTETAKAKKTEKLGKTLTKREIEKLVKDGAITKKTFKALCGNIEQFQKWTATELGKVSKEAKEAKKSAAKKPAAKKPAAKKPAAKKPAAKKPAAKKPAAKKPSAKETAEMLAEAKEMIAEIEEKEKKPRQIGFRLQNKRKPKRKRNPSGALGALADAFTKSDVGAIAMQLGSGTLGYMLPGLAQMGFKAAGITKWLTEKLKTTEKKASLVASTAGFVGSFLIGVGMQKQDFIKKSGAAMVIGAGVRFARDLVDSLVEPTTDTNKKIRTAFGLAGYNVWRPAYPGMGAYQDWYLQMSGYGNWSPAMSGYGVWRPALGAGPAAGYQLGAAPSPGYQLGRGPSAGYQLGAWKGNWKKNW